MLGLVKAQMVKNAVIVPVGAKGGFYAKQLPDPASTGRPGWPRAIACYRTFICGLLDVTDNLVAARSCRPPRRRPARRRRPLPGGRGRQGHRDLLRHRQRGRAVDYGFWLGDAFASGGSAGYDHKAMGITARGAWESVKRHFREMGVDCQSEDFTFVGIGDMSGDVFGNGMLLSRAHPAGGRVRPPAHLPRPRPRRGRPRTPSGDGCSSCRGRAGTTTTATLISAGGGVYPRTAKSIPISDAGARRARPRRRRRPR